MTCGRWPGENVSDPVTPTPVEVDFPALLAEPFRVVAYPIKTVLAEKIVTMIDRGDTQHQPRCLADIAGGPVPVLWCHGLLGPLLLSGGDVNVLDHA